jgi:hypothetical protein
LLPTGFTDLVLLKVCWVEDAVELKKSIALKRLNWQSNKNIYVLSLGNKQFTKAYFLFIVYLKMLSVAQTG